MVSWTTEAKDLTRPFVELMSYIVDLSLSQRAQVYFLGKILSEQAIRILVRAALPRTAGITEVDRHARPLGELFVGAKLGSSIPGQALSQVRWQTLIRSESAHTTSLVVLLLSLTRIVYRVCRSTSVAITV